MDSIMHDKLYGLLVLSGLQGLGKSTLAFTAEHPKKTLVMDFDLKGEKMARDYGIEQYFAPNFLKPDQDPTDYDADKIAKWAMEIFQKIKPETTNVVIDNATALEMGLGHIVEANPKKYGLNAKNVAAGIYGGANPGISILWQNITSFLQSIGVKTIIMVNHMSQPWAGGAPVPNRFHIKGNKIFRQLSVGTFILVPGETARGGKPPIPSMLVMKEALAIRKFNQAQKVFTTTRALPMRIPVADWSSITHYFEKPANFEKPATGELWTSSEVDTFGEFLSKEQLQWIKDAAKAGYSEEGDPGLKKPGTPVTDPLAAGRARLLNELKPHYNSMEELAATVKAHGLSYSVEKHDEIKAKLLELAQKPEEPVI